MRETESAAPIVATARRDLLEKSIEIVPFNFIVDVGHVKWDILAWTSSEIKTSLVSGVFLNIWTLEGTVAGIQVCMLH